MRFKSEALLPIIGVIGLIALWYAAVWAKVVDPVLLPPPRFGGLPAEARG